MVQEIKLTISENGEIIESLVRETETDPSALYKSLEEFQILANAALTKLVEKSQTDDMDGHNDEDTCSEDNDEEEIGSKAKRRKKKKMNS